MNRSWLERITGDAIWWPLVILITAFVILPPRFLRVRAAAPDRIGHPPLMMIAADPRQADRLYSGPFVSNDRGRTWSELKDARGLGIHLLGGPHALAPVVSPDGSLLFGEVLLDDPVQPLGRGPIAHAVEWRDGAWKVIRSETDADRYQPAMRVASLRYQPATRRPAVVMEDEIAGAIESETPGRTIAGAMGAASNACVAVHETGKFSLYCGNGPTARDWLPVADARDVVDVDATSSGVIYAAGDRFGKNVADKWVWTPWPPGFTAERVLAHPEKNGLVAALGKGRLIVTSNGGSSFADATPSGMTIESASWQPSTSDSMLVIDAKGDVYRLRL